jgi:hypothetical protein
LSWFHPSDDCRANEDDPIDVDHQEDFTELLDAARAAPGDIKTLPQYVEIRGHSRHRFPMEHVFIFSRACEDLHLLTHTHCSSNTGQKHVVAAITVPYDRKHTDYGQEKAQLASKVKAFFVFALPRSDIEYLSRYVSREDRVDSHLVLQGWTTVGLTMWCTVINDVVCCHQAAEGLRLRLR